VLEELRQFRAEVMQHLTALARAAQPPAKWLPDDLLSVKECAKHLGLHHTTIRSAIYSGKLPATNLATERMPHWRIRFSELMAAAPGLTGGK
jgi:excisionase family DNA binding protein